MEESKGSVAKYIAFGTVFIVIGVLFLIFREQVFEALYTIVRWILAGLIIVAGIINIILFIKDHQKVPNLVIGIMAIIAAICLMVFKDLVIWTICITVGAIMLVDGFFKIQRAVVINRAKAKGWAFPLIFGILNLVLGALAVFTPIKFGTAIGSLMVLVGGIVLIVTGIQNLIIGVAESGN